jgi:hypothetical protein
MKDMKGEGGWVHRFHGFSQKKFAALAAMP